MKVNSLKRNRDDKKHQKGFSYIDVMISMLIFLVGILAMAGALTANRMRAEIIENQLVAKQLALSTLESILAAKELLPAEGISGWDIIGNVGSNFVKEANRGVFVSGFSPIRQGNGVDGIIGTADDACSGTGSCGANNTPILTGYERKIEITDIPSTDYSAIRQRDVQVTIRYQVNGRLLEEEVRTIVADYR